MISVVICTRNRAFSLRRALQSLAAMEVPRDVAWELIVVDNGSWDATREVVDEFARATGLNVRHVIEATQGLSHARNRGLQEARREIVAFTDDDVQVDRSWLREILAEFDADPDLALLLGRTLPRPSGLAPLAVKESTERTYYLQPCSPRGIGYGNNMALRASTAAIVGLFDVALGAGTPQGGCDDVDYIYRVLCAGAKVLYSPVPLVYHCHDRTTPETVRALQLSYTRGWGGLLAKFALRGDIRMARLLLSEVARFVRIAIQRREARTMAVLRLWALGKGAAARVPTEIRRVLSGKR